MYLSLRCAFLNGWAKPSRNVESRLKLFQLFAESPRCCEMLIYIWFPVTSWFGVTVWLLSLSLRFKKSWFELKCFAITKIKWCYEIPWCCETGRRQEDSFLISHFYFSGYRKLNRGIMSSQALRQVSPEILLIFLKN